MTGQRSIQCGTRAGYQRHWRAGETPCDACRAAHSAYTSERRKDPEVRRREAAAQSLVQLATRDVLAAHPDEYRAALDKHRAEHLARRAAEILTGLTA